MALITSDFACIKVMVQGVLAHHSSTGECLGAKEMARSHVRQG